MSPPDEPRGQDRKQARSEKLAAALRRNLVRRKAAERRLPPAEAGDPDELTDRPGTQSPLAGTPRRG